MEVMQRKIVSIWCEVNKYTYMLYICSPFKAHLTCFELLK